MTSLAQELYQRALELVPNERAQLAELLFASLDEELTLMVKRRMDEVAAGTAQLVPWSQVRARLESIADS